MDFESEELHAKYFKNSRTFTSPLAQTENRDCFVIALANSCKIEYDKAHEIAKKHFRREDRKGTRMTTYSMDVFITEGREIEGQGFRFMGANPRFKWGINRIYLTNPNYKNKEVGFTVKSFLEHFTTGRYLVLVKGHALAIVDGKLFDNKNYKYKGWYRDIEHAYEVI